MKTILVVDDLAIFREPIEMVLRTEGYDVLTASNGVEALAAISVRQIDLVLLDLGMPVMDGLTVLRKMREDAASKALTVIVLSAESDRARIVEAMKLGISGFLLKSQFSLKTMLERVKNVLGDSGSSRASAVERASEPQLPSHEATTPAAAVRAEAIRASQAQPATTLPAKLDALKGHNPSGSSAVREASQSALTGTAHLNCNTDIKSLRPLMTRSDLLKRLNAEEELTGFSPTVTQVLKITASQKHSMEQVAKAVGQDHAIALKIMKLANSSIYSRGDRVDTVQKAVLRIGVQNIRQVVLNIGVVERFGSADVERHLSTPLFWEHSIACGMIAAELAHALGHKDPDVAFTTGLLHDLGRVLYAERLGEQYAHVIETAQAMQLPLEQVESRLLMLNHAEVMDNILRAWRFPKDLVNPIVFHHASPSEAKTLAPNQTSEVLRLGLANRLAHAMLLGSSGNDTIYPTEEHCRLLKVDPEKIRRIEDTARQQIDDTKLALLTDSHGANWPRRVEQLRAAFTAPFCPLYVSGSPKIDAYRLFFTELAGPLGDGPPNVAILHVTGRKERDSLLEKLVSAEGSAQVANLPLLILSDSPAFTDFNLPTRQCRILETPVTSARIITTINSLVDSKCVQRAA